MWCSWGVCRSACRLHLVSLCRLGTIGCPFRPVLLVRGTMVNRTYGTHRNLHISIFLLTIFGPIYYGPPYYREESVASGRASGRGEARELGGRGAAGAATMALTRRLGTQEMALKCWMRACLLLDKNVLRVFFSFFCLGSLVVVCSVFVATATQ